MVDKNQDTKKEKDPIVAEIALRIREYRESRHLTQDYIAEKANISQKHLSRVESGYHDPKFTTIIKVANALNIPVDALATDMADDDISVFLKSIQPDVEKLSSEQKKFIKSMIKQLAEIDD